MQPIKLDRQRSLLCSDLLVQPGPQNHLLGLAKVIPWQVIEDNFQSPYAASTRPAKPIRLMVGLLILKQLENLSNDRGVEIWIQNPFFTSLCGQQRLTWMLSCDPYELNYFRHRNGEDDVRKIIEISAALHVDKAKEEVEASSVQEKNITIPTNAKQLTKIVARCRIMDKLEDAILLRSYPCEIKKLLRTMRFRLKDRKQGEAQRSARRLRTITGILIRDMRRKISLEALQVRRQPLDPYNSAQSQQRPNTGKIYSIHEPNVSRIITGKAHKNYEFSVKTSVTETKISSIIVGARFFLDKPFDSHTLSAKLSQVAGIVDKKTTMTPTTVQIESNAKPEIPVSKSLNQATARNMHTKGEKLRHVFTTRTPSNQS